MRRIRPAVFQPPFEDGAVLTADFRHSPGPVQTSTADLERLRRIRGDLISLCVEIRNKLNTLLVMDEFGPGGAHDLMFGRRVDFVTSVLGIADKIEGSRSVIRTLFRERADGVFYRLFEASRLFQLMVSRPFFTVERADSTHDLCVADEQFIWTVDDTQLNEWTTLLARCLADLDEAARQLPLLARQGLQDEPLRMRRG